MDRVKQIRGAIQQVLREWLRLVAGDQRRARQSDWNSALGETKRRPDVLTTTILQAREDQNGHFVTER